MYIKCHSVGTDCLHMLGKSKLGEELEIVRKAFIYTIAREGATKNTTKNADV